MRTMLRIRGEYCQFPGCMAKAATSEVDHIVNFQSGGTTFDNLESLCLHHHLLRHFKDDKIRAGE
ncbi:HNH endonuclease signature motif containing protein [Arthrobacter alpinus]|uniref:HNH endonuclease signature motif containing protein n=1 Tax=Arthrobacter alpinus TaxID=656366 RepID=UPI0009F259E6